MGFVEIVPGLHLDGSYPAIAHMLDGEQYCLWPDGVQTEAVLVFAELLNASIRALTADQLAHLLAFLRSRPCGELAAAISTESQAAGFASAI